MTAAGREPMPADATVGSIGERALLRRLRARIPAADGVLLGIGDDAAVLATGAATLMTTDALVEGVHFRREWSSARRVGRKALSVNLSDVGAMAGRARFATVSLCLPAALPVSWIDALYDGLLERAAETGTALVGGNVSGIDGPLVIDVALLGESSRPLRRAGARPGDAIVVTGRLGLAEAGLALLAAGWRLGDDDGVGGYEPAADDVAALRACLRAQLDPAPPLAFAAALATAPGIHAGMDLSDGLSGDLAALCGESGVSALVRSSRLPLGPALERQGGGDPLLHALHGGEDYELLLAVDPAHVGGLEELARVHGVGVVAVGALAEGPPSVWLDAAEGRVPLPPHAHQHFAPPEGER